MSLILSEHFRLAEFTTSLVAVTRRIDNTPPLPAICNLQQLCLHVLEPLRAHLGHAVRINSGYRSPRLNAAVGGVKTSDHTRGCAADIFVPDVKTGRQWFAWMMDNLPFDQLIWETASKGQAQWIHVGYRGAGRNRQQVIGQSNSISPYLCINKTALLNIINFCCRKLILYGFICSHHNPPIQQ